jgi:phage repressor protein C with HTH and peptisase S24 domain
MTPGEKIRQARERLGWSQAELAKRVGIKQPSIQNIENGRTKDPRKLPEIAMALNLPLSELRSNVVLPRGSNAKVDKFVTDRGEYDFPVYFSVGATSGLAGEIVVSPNPVEWVQRPMLLDRVPDSYGVRVSGTSMEPAYEAGDIVFVHPYMPPLPDCDVLLRAEDDHGEQRAMLKRLVRETATHWCLRQWNPAEGEKAEFSVRKGDWPKAERVVGKYNRR